MTRPALPAEGAAALRASLVSALMMVLTAAVSGVVVPGADVETAPPDLEALLPEAFGPWRRVQLGPAVLPPETDLEAGETVAYRAYRDDLGRRVTLVAAYGPPRGDSVRLHRPETCYRAQGFDIAARSRAAVETPRGPAPVIHMLTKNPIRSEAVSYWLRSGDAFVTAAPSAQWINFRRGLARPLDGALIRVSTAGGDGRLFSLHEEFLREFAASLDGEGARVFLGAEAR